MDILIAHISDLHVSKEKFLPEKLESCINEVNKLKPDFLAITGDITLYGFENEYKKAKEYIEQFKLKKKLIIPGNHDARYCGDKYFDKFFGFGNKVMEISDDVTVVGVDSSVPDLDEGTVGRGKQRWLRRELQKIPKDKFKIVAIHHHLIPIPKTGRERNILTDSGDVLELLVQENVDLVLCGHRHTPYVWVLESLPIITAGTVSSEKVRAEITQCYNIIEIKDDGQVKVRLKEIDGKEKIIKSV